MTGQNIVGHDEWDTASTYTLERREKYIGRTTDISIRFDNRLDANVDVRVGTTDLYDDDNSRINFMDFWSNRMLGPLYRREQGSMTNLGDTKTVSAGACETYLITEEWTKVIIEVTPATVPTSGELEIVELMPDTLDE